MNVEQTSGQQAGQPPPLPSHEKGWFGQPRGLSTLFFTEMWERLSFYGMRALLFLYMVAPVEKGGLGFEVVNAGAIYGWYTMMVYAMGLPGGLIADRFLGQYNAILLGGCLIIAGEFSLAVGTVPFFFLGLGLITIGTGLLKPNATSMVGSLYEPGDPRRESGFSLYYLGINVGATIAPFICGTLGQKVAWQLGFASAGLGMIVGVVQLWLGKERLRPAMDRIKASKQVVQKGSVAAHTKLTLEEWRRLGVVAVLFIFAMIFFAALEQAGSSLNLFADEWTRLPTIVGFTIPSSWFQSLNPAFIIIFAPVFAWMWKKWGERQPSSPAKFAYGLLLLSLGFLLLVPAAGYAQANALKVSGMWLVGVYLFNTIGELCLSPVGLSMVTKLAPPRMVGSIMGFWFLSMALGNKISGAVGGQFKNMPLWELFGWVFLVPFVAGVILLFLVRPLKRMMGGVK